MADDNYDNDRNATHEQDRPVTDRVPEPDSRESRVSETVPSSETGALTEVDALAEVGALSEPPAPREPDPLPEPDAGTEPSAVPERSIVPEPDADRETDAGREFSTDPEASAVPEPSNVPGASALPENTGESPAAEVAGASTSSPARGTALPEPVAGSGSEAKPLTAVALGLLPETFVSQVSTQLLFYAPEFVPLPALPVEVAADEAPQDQSQGSARRRNRRRAGEEQDGEPDGGTVIRVRQPRTAEPITEPQRIKGSTRLEAKKQRRRDGREAGRRRPVVTEAEFLARRESVDRVMVVRSKGGRIQIAVLEDNVLVEHYVARNQDASLIGNVYVGRVQNVLPSMEAAFVDIGRGRNAVLYSGEVDWDSVETGNQPRRIELALKSGDTVLVQVTKDPVGHKGARLTSQISLPGRYLVYVPGGAMNGISRKLPDTERARLKRILKEVLPESSGVIVRTAAEGATEDQLTRDVNRLMAQWERVSTQVGSMQAPALLHSEPDLLVKIVRDVFNEDFTKMVIQGEDALHTIEGYLESVAPDLLDRIERFEGDRDPFDEFRVSEQIEKALDRKVWLPSGGSLVIDRTEAMTVVDVNTGKFVGTGGNLEETVTKNNLEAAEEIVRQLRLRDIGGIIVVDFIDMVLESNRDLVLRRLMECLSRDRTKHQVAEVTSLGLVQMTRKKLGLGLLETFSEACEVCAGRGVVVHHDPVVRHRANSSGGSGNASGNGNGQNRRSRGGSQGGSNQPIAGGAHVITEGVKTALAQIAASTLGHGADAEAAPAAAAAMEAELVSIVLPEGPAGGRPAQGERPKKRRKRSDRSDRSEGAERFDDADREEPDRSARAGGGDRSAHADGGDRSVLPDGAERSARADGGDRSARADGGDRSVLPDGAERSARADGGDRADRGDRSARTERSDGADRSSRTDRSGRAAQSAGSRVPRSEKDQLLESVLQALPEPKAPGQGRAARRRVSTGIVTGTPVVMPGADD